MIHTAKLHTYLPAHGFSSLPIIVRFWPFYFVTYLKVIYSQSCAIIPGVISPLSKCASTVNYWRLYQLCVDIMDIYYILTTWQKSRLQTINIIWPKEHFFWLKNTFYLHTQQISRYSTILHFCSTILHFYMLLYHQCIVCLRLCAWWWVGGVGGLLTTHCCHLLLAGVHSGHSWWPPDLRSTPAQTFIPLAWTLNGMDMDFVVRRRLKTRHYVGHCHDVMVRNIYNSVPCFSCLYSVILWLCRCCFECIIRGCGSAENK